jgi:hypothetical protein
VTGPGPYLVATGWSLYLPGADLAAALPTPPGEAYGEWAHRIAAPPEHAARVLGRKGLLAKEPATRLALCAVHRALGLPSGRRPVRPLEPRTAVVACSNLGNVESVARVARTVASDGGTAVSILDAPNVTSNVLASSVALWFGFGGPNLMVCSGADSGLAGLRLAGLLLRADRADRVVLVGAEPADEVATALHATGSVRWPLRAGAACVVFETGVADGPGRALVELVPGDEPWPRLPRLAIGRDGLDPRDWWGDCHGAHGVVALALAAHLAVNEGYGAVGVDGTTAALVSSTEHVRLGGYR